MNISLADIDFFQAGQFATMVMLSEKLLRWYDRPDVNVCCCPEHLVVFYLTVSFLKALG